MHVVQEVVKDEGYCVHLTSGESIQLGIKCWVPYHGNNIFKNMYRNSFLFNMVRKMNDL